jgi:phosphoenolpyruvate carboxykinase (ATP)
MARHPSVYARLLGEKISGGKIRCWLLNTGWSGGGYGVGERMDIDLTRSLLSAALNGEMDDIEYKTHPIFGLQMPQTLDPMETWSDQDAYLETARALAVSFKKAFAPFESEVPEAVVRAGPL